MKRHDESRFGADWQQTARDHAKAGRVVSVHIPGGFDEPRQLMGEEGLCIAYYEQPELVHAMLETMGETAYRVLDHRIPNGTPLADYRYYVLKAWEIIRREESRLV